MSFPILTAFNAPGESQATVLDQLFAPEWNPIAIIPDKSPGAKEQL